MHDWLPGKAITLSRRRSCGIMHAATIWNVDTLLPLSRCR